MTGGPELVILLIVVIVVFGASWLPKTARNLGRAKVELDKTQKQLTDAKNQVVEATGLDKAEQALRKANRTLNQTPQGLIKGAAASALAPKPSPANPAAEVTADTVATDAVATDAVATETACADEIIDAVIVEKAQVETVNVDYSAEEG